MRTPLFPGNSETNVKIRYFVQAIRLDFMWVVFMFFYFVTFCITFDDVLVFHKEAFGKKFTHLMSGKCHSCLLS